MRRTVPDPAARHEIASLQAETAAHAAHRRGAAAEAAARYREAAESAARALIAISVRDRRRRALAVVRTVSLWAKAGDHAEAARVARAWLAGAQLPRYARADLAALLRGLERPLEARP